MKHFLATVLIVAIVTPGIAAPEPPPSSEDNLQVTSTGLKKQSCDSYSSTPLCHAHSSLGQIMAQAICTALKHIPLIPTPTGKGHVKDFDLVPGMVFAVPKTTGPRSTNCDVLCRSLSKPKIKSIGNLECFNSLHLYGNEPAQASNTLGLRTYVYYRCGGPTPEEKKEENGWAGPNYCCCARAIRE